MVKVTVHVTRAAGFAVVPLVLASLASACAPANIHADDGPRVSGLPKTVYAAHRGGSLEVPENSMAGLLATYRQHITEVLDVDVRTLRDGTLVAMHDATLNRTTDHKGPVSALTLRDWRRVRLRPFSGLPGSWHREHPPTLAAILDRFGGRTVLNIEVKDRGGLKGLVRAVRARGLTHSVYVQSNKLSVATRAHRMGMLTSVWRSTKQARKDRPAKWPKVVDMLSVDYRARDTDIRRAVKSGIPRVWSHTITTPADRDRVLGLGCDGVLTDAPRMLARTPERHAERAPSGHSSGHTSKHTSGHSTGHAAALTAPRH